jgi:hypothetical protein
MVLAGREAKESKSRHFVKGVVGKAEAETEMERVFVVSGAELGLWDAEIRQRLMRALQLVV